MLTPEQISHYLEGELDEAQQVEFEAQLAADPESAREAFDQQRMDQALRALLADPTAQQQVRQSILAVILSRPIADLKAQVLDTTFLRRQVEPEQELEEADEPAGVIPPGKIIRLFRPKVLAWTTFAAAACLVIGLGVNWLLTEKLTLASATSGVTLSRDGQSIPFTVGTRLQQGDVLETDASAFASLRYSDGTRLQLSPGVKLTISHQPGNAKQLDVANGIVAVEAAPQPAGRPMELRTPHATATVVGTEFHLEVQAGSTRLEVSEGKVRVGQGGAAVELGASQFVEAAPGRTLTVGDVARDPLQWPFAVSSPWNQALGSQARFEPVNSTAFKVTGSWAGTLVQRPVYRATAGEPMRQFRGNTSTVRLPFADEWTIPPPTELTAVGVLAPQFPALMEFREARRLASGDVQARFQSQADLLGSGVPPESHGVADFGGPGIAGALRKGELTTGIRHALALAVPARSLNQKAPGGNPFVWPANRATVLWRNSYGTSGNLFLGSLLALPPAVDLAKLGVGSSGPGYELARAMQDYGVYVTDASSQVPKLFTVDEQVPSDFDALVSKLLPHLQIVVNNSHSTIGGGGSPRRPAAPPLASR